MTQVSFEQTDQLREFLFTLIESLPNGMLFATPDGSLLAANQKACRILGLSGSSILHRSVWDVLSQSLGVPGDLVAQLRIPKGKILYAAAPGREEGSGIYLSIARNELNSPFLHTAGFFLSFEDVTFPAMVATQIDRHNRFAAMQDMALSMSQELKNPLGGLQLYASLLKRELAGDSENSRIAAQMLNAIRTMDYLLDNYVTFAALPAARLEAVNVRALLERTAARLKALAAGVGISIHCRCDHAEAEIPGDETLLTQLFLNIGMNGIESMEKGGTLRILTRTLAPTADRTAFLEVRVIDSGEGIPAAHFGRIFDPFFTTRDRAKGLGLAIVHHIVEAHQGLVRVDSDRHRGTTFTVLLPAGGVS